MNKPSFSNPQNKNRTDNITLKVTPWHGNTLLALNENNPPVASGVISQNISHVEVSCLSVLGPQSCWTESQNANDLRPGDVTMTLE